METIANQPKKQSYFKSFIKAFQIRRFPMDLGRLVCAPLLLIFRMKKYNPDGTRYKGIIRGGAVAVANHRSFVDPFYLGTALWYRRVFCLASELVMRNPFVRILLRGMGCIKIDRTISDITAVKKTVALLKKGNIVAIFPEGTLKTDDSVDSIKSGAILFALQANVPIIPMYIKKREHWYNRQKVVIGNPFLCSDYCKKKMPSLADINELSNILLEKMNECRMAFQKI